MGPLLDPSMANTVGIPAVTSVKVRTAPKTIKFTQLNTIKPLKS